MWTLGEIVYLCLRICLVRKDQCDMKAFKLCSIRVHLASSYLPSFIPYIVKTNQCKSVHRLWNYCCKPFGYNLKSSPFVFQVVEQSVAIVFVYIVKYHLIDNLLPFSAVDINLLNLAFGIYVVIKTHSFPLYFIQLMKYLCSCQMLCSASLNVDYPC